MGQHQHKRQMCALFIVSTNLERNLLLFDYYTFSSGLQQKQNNEQVMVTKKVPKTIMT